VFKEMTGKAVYPTPPTDATLAMLKAANDDFHKKSAKRQWAVKWDTSESEGSFPRGDLVVFTRDRRLCADHGEYHGGVALLRLLRRKHEPRALTCEILSQLLRLIQPFLEVPASSPMPAPTLAIFPAKLNRPNSKLRGTDPPG
jgi:hypothetical protein